MAVKTYGNIRIDKKHIVIESAEPHICIRLKQIFPKINKTHWPPFKFEITNENAHDLLWFMQRYPLQIDSKDLHSIRRKSLEYTKNLNEIESIFTPSYIPHEVVLSNNKKARTYQLAARDFYYKVNKYLLGDDLGTGKTITAILGLVDHQKLPAVVIVPPHLIPHWIEKIQEFTNLKIHCIKQGKPYNLPSADVYITRYNFLYKWVDIYKNNFFYQAIFDEIQELRHNGTLKYDGAKALTANVKMAIGMSATPIYNYGHEIFNIVNILNPGALGTREEFIREWCASDRKKVIDPKALGTYLREKNLMLRRTRKEIGRELPPVNTLVYTVEYDQETVKSAEQQAIQLAIKTTTGAFVERGQAARELDVFLRRITGLSKAKHVAEFVKILLENGEPIVLAGWHRDVYDIWRNELAEFKPVFYTGSESPQQKESSKQAFLNGETNLFIMSLRSGVGLDGLQFRAKTIVYGELDYSPKVHDQFTARVDRDGQTEQVTAIYLVADDGSDPVIIDMLGVKASQASGVMDPSVDIFNRTSDESRIKILAAKYLEGKNIEIKPES